MNGYPPFSTHLLATFSCILCFFCVRLLLILFCCVLLIFWNLFYTISIFIIYLYFINFCFKKKTYPIIKTMVSIQLTHNNGTNTRMSTVGLLLDSGTKKWILLCLWSLINWFRFFSFKSQFLIYLQTPENIIFC